MLWSRLLLPATIALSFGLASQAATEENAEDFMGIHKIEIIFHEAGTTKNLDLMLSLFADDATLTSGGCRSHQLGRYANSSQRQMAHQRNEGEFRA